MEINAQPMIQVWKYENFRLHKVTQGDNRRVLKILFTTTYNFIYVFFKGSFKY